ncbi:MAG: hypothetical protein COA68_06800 [Oceanobacter sp.]|nr:MAG: hypothetical protein COA68_06800 [Oceanobacter sp.]
MRNAFCCKLPIYLKREFSDAMRIPLLVTLMTAVSFNLYTHAADEEETNLVNDNAATETATAAANSQVDTKTPSIAEDTSPESQNPARLRVRPYPDAERHQSLIEYLQQHQRQQEVMTLVAGEASFYGLFLRERSGNPQGGILILHDLEQHGHWPTLVAPLREGLTEHGWTTLAIELPTAPGRTIPRRSEALTDQTDTVDSIANEPEIEGSDAENVDTNNSPENSTDSAVETDENSMVTTAQASPSNSLNAVEPDINSMVNTYDEAIQARIDAALSFLNSRGQLNLAIIAVGDSAIWAAKHIQSRQRDNDNARGIALLMINAREFPGSPLRLTQVLETLDVPILDLITGDSTQSDWQINDRKGAMKRKHLMGYQQIQQSSASIRDTSINRRIRGWLKSNAAGTELP